MVSRKAWSIQLLAEESGMDAEEVLIALWGAGIEYPLQPSHRVRASDSRAAERAVGIVASQQKNVSYWLDALGVTREELASRLAAVGISLEARARTVPKGAVRKLRGLQGASIPVGAREAEAQVPRPPAPAFQWLPVGSIRNCEFLSADEIRSVHEALTEDFAESEDPILPPGVKSMDLLESAATRPATSLGGVYKYPTVESAAAALLHSLVQNHPFHNGNKRTALVSMLVFLDRHNLRLESTQDELFKFMIRVAAHRLLDDKFAYDQIADREVSAIATWVSRNSRTVRKDERAITWRELSRRLRDQRCEILQGRGEKIVITREIKGRRRFFGVGRLEKLESSFINTGDGREVPRSVLKRIRQELLLDAEHGVDSEMFYGGVKDSDFFIAEYSKLLKRLARV
ncbi:MAG: type toxin-antitoxin system death-on-curing family toxin [Naasia sp.]|uniref:type II toxin-antitoxin system death-on-curing family toxin n=1 Tax=Naasia sp. TaxID=2546198 RepID=UPI002631CC6D|nr:type II toxin-antitoxin system death-on-curing family toxin [Naasia sp.]MCU1571321.1 type toxin-antitoxin system death-on-curing family toxin [Naasia sp.]